MNRAYLVLLGSCLLACQSPVTRVEAPLLMGLCASLGASPLAGAEHEALKQELDFWFGVAQRRGLRLGSQHLSEPQCKLSFELLPLPAAAAQNAPQRSLEQTRFSMHLELRLSFDDPYGELFLHAELRFCLLGAELDSGALWLSASEQLMQQLQAQLEVAVLDENELGELLISRVPETLRLGLAELRRRGQTPFVYRVRDLLLHDDRQVVLAAVATLGQLRDADSVSAIAGLLVSRDFEKLSQAIYALGAIRSDDALDILRSVAGRHPNELVRMLARDTLHRATKNRTQPKP